MRPTRPGFAYLWIIVVFGTVTAIIAAAALPMLDTTADMTKANETAITLRAVAQGVLMFDSEVSNNVHVTPWRLSQLTTQISGTDSMGCTQHAFFTGSQPGNWTTHGPFLADYFPTDDLWTPLGPINNTPSESAYVAGVRRTSNNSLPYYIQISNVDVKFARMLDLLIDGTSNSTGDTLFYSTPAADSTVLVSYRVYGFRPSAC